MLFRSLVFDIDGTLSPYVPGPQKAQLYPGVASLLQQAQEHAHVAILTSRALNDGAAMVNVDKLTYKGTRAPTDQVVNLWYCHNGGAHNW